MKRTAESLGAIRPRSYEELRAVLASGSAKLPKRLRDVAVFLWQHPGEVALGSSTRVSEQAGVLPSTLVRFAQHLGYAGFSDLQELFKTHIKESHPSASRSKGPEASAPGERSSAALVGGFLQAAQDSLTRAAKELDVASFDLATELVSKADIVYLVGSKRAYPVTTYMSIALSKLGIRNVLVDNVGSSAFDQIGGATERDIMVAVTFSPYNSITADVVAAGVQKGVPLVSITDSALSPVVPLSTAWIEVVESDYAGFRSPAATITIATAVVLAVSRLREDKAQAKVKPRRPKANGAVVPAKLKVRAPVRR